MSGLPNRAVEGEMVPTHIPAAENNTGIFERSLLEGVDALPSGLAIFTAQGELVIANRRFREMLPSGAALLDAGGTFADMAKHNAMTAFGIGDDEIDAWMERRMENHRAEHSSFDQRLCDGRWFRINESRTGEGGTVTNWTDITDLKNQEQETQNLMSALTATNEELKEFAHVASHDLQEPLRKIETFAERLIAKSGNQLNEQGQAYLDRVVDAAQRMRQLITGLLDYSRVENRADAFVPVELDDVLTEATSSLEIVIEEKGATIDCAPLPKVTGDRNQLYRLFLNLISNALKYTEPGTTPHIRIGVAQAGDGTAVVTITDNGIGFEQEQADAIFKIFQRLHGRGSSYEGTGIGLATCRKIVERHGGAIWATSAPGKGSTFHVRFPAS